MIVRTMMRVSFFLTMVGTMTEASGLWNESLTQTITNTDSYSWFGSAIAASKNGEIVAIGSKGESSEGRVHVMRWESSTSAYEAFGDGFTYVIDDPDAMYFTENFGNSLDLSDDGLTIIVGMTGLAQSYPGRCNSNGGGAVVYRHNGTEWSQHGGTIGSFQDSGTTLTGLSVAMSSNGNIVAVSAYPSAGIVKVFAYDESFVPSGVCDGSGTNGWVQLGSTFTGEGRDVSLSGDGTILSIAGQDIVNSPCDFDYCHVQINVHRYDSNVWNRLGEIIEIVPYGDKLVGKRSEVNADGTILVAAVLSTNQSSSGDYHYIDVRAFQLNGAEQWESMGQNITYLDHHGGVDTTNLELPTVSVSADGNVFSVSYLADGAVIFAYNETTEMWISIGGDLEVDGYNLATVLSGDATTVTVADSVSSDEHKVRLYRTTPNCANIPFDEDVTTCLDCAGVVNGASVHDACNVCGGDNTTCLDCEGVPNGDVMPGTCDVYEKAGDEFDNIHNTLDDMHDEITNSATLIEEVNVTSATIIEDLMDQLASLQARIDELSE